MANSSNESAGDIFERAMGSLFNTSKDTSVQLEELNKVQQKVYECLVENNLSNNKTKELLKAEIELLKGQAKRFQENTLTVGQIENRIKDWINQNASKASAGKESGIDLKGDSKLAKEMQESIKATDKLVDALEAVIDALKEKKFALGAKLSGAFRSKGQNGQSAQSSGDDDSKTNKIGAAITGFFTSRKFWGKFAAGIIEGITGAKALQKGFKDILYLGVLLLSSWIKKTFGGIPAAIAFIAMTLGGGKFLMGGVRNAGKIAKLTKTAFKNPRAIARLANIKRIRTMNNIGKVASAFGKIGKVGGLATLGGALVNAGKGGLDFIMGGATKKAAGQAAKKATAKTAAKVAGKAGLKALAKKAPFGVGLVAGGIFAAQRAMAGDWGGAGLELASGAASIVPGVGTAASIGIDAALAAKDMGAFDKKGGTPADKGGTDKKSWLSSPLFKTAVTAVNPALGMGLSAVDKLKGESLENKDFKKSEEERNKFYKKVLQFLEIISPPIKFITTLAKGFKKLLEKFGLSKSSEKGKEYLKKLGITKFNADSGDGGGYDPHDPSIPGDTDSSGYKKSIWGDKFDGHRITTQWNVKDKWHPTGHRGVDFAYNKGEKVGAKIGGMVTYAQKGDNGGYGNLVIVEDDKGYKHYYAHLAEIGVQEGQEVKQGTTLGIAGSTGHSSGTHLHYEVRRPGQKNQLGASIEGKERWDIDPLQYLSQRRKEMLGVPSGDTNKPAGVKETENSSEILYSKSTDNPNNWMSTQADNPANQGKKSVVVNNTNPGSQTNQLFNSGSTFGGLGGFMTVAAAINGNGGNNGSGK